MGIFDKLSNATRNGIEEFRDMNRDRKPLSELSDKELEEELIRRRRARAQGRPVPLRDREDSPRRKQVLQWFANLELKPSASEADVRAAYKRLMKKYHPDKHQGDDQRYRSATELAQSLTSAMQGLLAYMKSQQ